MQDQYGIDKLELTEYEKKTLNDWVGFFSFQPTWAYKQLMNSDEQMICLFIFIPLSLKLFQFIISFYKDRCIL